MTTRSDVINEARSWLGIRWRHKGRSRSWGVDCVGLIYVVGKELGLTDYDNQGYNRDTSTVDIHPYLIKAGMSRRDNLIDTRVGDVLLIHDKVMPLHMAIYSGSMTTIQANAYRRMVIEEPYKSARDVIACYIYPGLEDG